MANTNTFEEQMHLGFTSIINVALEAISVYVEKKTGETISVEELREVISQPSNKSVSVVITSVKKEKEIPADRRCCKPIIGGRSTKDICGKRISEQIFRDGGIFCAACRKQPTLATRVAHILEERGMSLHEATGGVQGESPAKKHKKYETSNDDSDEDNDSVEEEEEEEEVKTPPKRSAKVVPNSRLINAASQKKRSLKK